MLGLVIMIDLWPCLSAQHSTIYMCYIDVIAGGQCQLAMISAMSSYLVPYLGFMSQMCFLVVTMSSRCDCARAYIWGFCIWFQYTLRPLCAGALMNYPCLFCPSDNFEQRLALPTC